jgi:hypothetical protein
MDHTHPSDPQNRFDTSLVPIDTPALAAVGQVANQHAARSVFADYLSRKADNTLRRQAADLARFADFLTQVGERAGLQLGVTLGAFAQAVADFPEGPDPDASAWQGVTWGLVEGFRNWMVAQGYPFRGMEKGYLNGVE